MKDPNSHGFSELEIALDEASRVINEQTSIDLGDDLLAGETRTLSPSSSGVRVPDPELAPFSALPSVVGQTGEQIQAQIQDQLESARILANESMTEEAKRVLRRILLSDPGNVTARDRLHEIHERELQELFHSGAPRGGQARRGRSGVKLPEPGFSGKASANDLIRQLDQDLGLGLDLPSSSQSGASSLFHDLERDLSGASPRDRLDLGIGFLEMGLYELAVHQFRVAARSSVLEVQAQSLVALALIQVNKPFDAIVELQRTLRSAEIAESDKIDLFYWMGRAYEASGTPEQARPWYEQTRKLDPYYRDVQDRLQ